MRTQRSVFTDVGMTATDKSILIFLLPHVIGPAPGEIFDEKVYYPLASAVAHMQLVLIASGGQRGYTASELDTIFNKGFILIFGALESVREIIYRRQIITWSRSATKNPPKRFKPMSR